MIKAKIKRDCVKIYDDATKNRIDTIKLPKGKVKIGEFIEALELKYGSKKERK